MSYPVPPRPPLFWCDDLRGRLSAFDGVWYSVELLIATGLLWELYTEIGLTLSTILGTAALLLGIGVIIALPFIMATQPSSFGFSEEGMVMRRTWRARTFLPWSRVLEIVFEPRGNKAGLKSIRIRDDQNQVWRIPRRVTKFEEAVSFCRSVCEEYSYVLREG